MTQSIQCTVRVRSFSCASAASPRTSSRSPGARRAASPGCRTRRAASRRLRTRRSPPRRACRRAPCRAEIRIDAHEEQDVLRHVALHPGVQHRQRAAELAVDLQQRQPSALALRVGEQVVAAQRPRPRTCRARASSSRGRSARARLHALPSRATRSSSVTWISSVCMLLVRALRPPRSSSSPSSVGGATISFGAIAALDDEVVDVRV